MSPQATSKTIPNLFFFSGNIRILNLTWVTFFITFMIWFAHAPLMAAIRETFGLYDQDDNTVEMIDVV